MRLGIFGGTFDPVQFGHLALAEECLAAANLDELWLVPAASPPHKGGKILSRFDQRKEMLEHCSENIQVSHENYKCTFLIDSWRL